MFFSVGSFRSEVQLRKRLTAEVSLRTLFVGTQAALGQVQRIQGVEEFLLPFGSGEVINSSDGPKLQFHAAEAQDSGLTKVEPTSGGQQRPEFARPLRQVDHAADPAQLQVCALSGRVAVQILPPALPSSPDDVPCL